MTSGLPLACIGAFNSWTARSRPTSGPPGSWSSFLFEHDLSENPLPSRIKSGAGFFGIMLRLMDLQILNNRPALRDGQAGAVFVSAISVPIGILGVSNKGGILERRLIGRVANVLRIKNAA